MLNYRRIVTTAICFAASITMFAQDIIFRKNGTDIQAIVQKSGTDEIRYKKFDNQNGPIYRLKKSEIAMIRYEDGDRDVFNDASTPVEDRIQTSVDRQDNHHNNIIYSDYQLPVLAYTSIEQDYEQLSKKIYLGAGGGLDYGGLLGGKLEFLPIKYIGLFAGAGYNLLSLGWNIGGTLKILPDKKVSPNLMLMYGYNAVIVGSDFYSEQYETTSYGITVGGNIDIKIGRKNKISTGLFVPFRSKEFKKIHDNAENTPGMSLTPLLPITFSVGFNFGL